MPDAAELWAFLPWGYLLTVLIEAPILLVGLTSRFTLRDRLIAAFWLTACTYPIVVIVLPQLVWANWGRIAYVAVAETFAPLAECLLLRAAYGPAPNRQTAVRDYGAVVLANVASFAIGEFIHAWN